VTSPRVSSTVPGGHASRSDDAALDEGSRVSTRHRHPDEVRRVTILRPTRPAPPTTRTSSSPFRSSFAERRHLGGGGIRGGGRVGCRRERPGSATYPVAIAR
jgi:hypothetical protein